MLANLTVKKYNNVSKIYLGEQQIEINKETSDDRPLFEIFEYEKVTVAATGYAENIEILIETADSETLVELLRNEELCISEGNEDSSIFVPGDYSIQFNNQNLGIDRFHFRVVSNRIDWNGLLAIKEELERFQHGLSFDLAGKTRESYISGSESATRNIISRIEFLLSSKNKIIGTMKQLIDLQYAEAKKSYKTSEHVKKVDGKSIKWLTTKGMGVNDDPFRPDVLMQPRNVPSLANGFNIALKKQIEYWNYEVVEIKSLLGATLKSLLSKKNLLSREIELKNSKVTELENEKFVSEKSRFRLKNEISRAQVEVDLFEKRLEDVNRMKARVDDLSIALNQLLRNTWINQLPTMHNAKQILTSKQVRLYPILSIRKNYESLIAIGVKTEYTAFSKRNFKSKKTSELYELYVLLSCIKVITSLGYKIDDYSLDSIYGINSGQSFLFIGNEGICKISYDREIKRNNYDFESDDYCYINGTHNKPDIIIGFYKFDEIIPYKNIIVEVKCANVRRIFNDIEDTEIMLQVKDYFNFGYFDSIAQRTKRAVIDKVIVVNPYPSESITNIMEGSIISVPLYPKENNIIGFDYLLEEITN
jgi:hypothetical protein